MRQVVHSEEEWKQLLSPAQYSVLREANTERSFSSPLYNVRMKALCEKGGPCSMGALS